MKWHQEMNEVKVQSLAQKMKSHVGSALHQRLIIH